MFLSLTKSHQYDQKLNSVIFFLLFAKIFFLSLFTTKYLTVFWGYGIQY